MNKHHHKTIPTFELWLEFEATEPWEEPTNGFANIGVNMQDGRYYGINVWTYKFVQTAYQEEQQSGKNNHAQYLLPPDLLVEELSRTCIEGAISDLLSKGNLEEQLNPNVFGLKFTVPWEAFHETSQNEGATAALGYIQNQYPQYAQNALLIAHRVDTNEWVLELENKAMIKFAHPIVNTNRIDYYANAIVFWNKYLKDCLLQNS